MRQPFETAPKDGSLVVLDDDASGACEVARWSADARGWVGENGEPSKITPTHWYPYGLFPFASNRAPSPSRAPADPFSPCSVAPATPVSLKACDADAASIDTNSTPRARRRFAAASISVALAALVAFGLYFRAEFDAYVTRYAGQYDIPGFGRQVVAQATRLLSLDLRGIYLSALQRPPEVNSAREPAAGPETTHVKWAVETPAPQARRSITEEAPEAKAQIGLLTDELAEAKRASDRLQLQLQEGSANSARLLEQERDKAAALLRDVTAAQQALTESTEHHHRALEEERARSAVLTNDLAIARREVEAKAAQLRKAEDDAAQFKHTADTMSAQLQQEHDKAEALSRQLAAAREPAQRASNAPAANGSTSASTQSAETAASEQAVAAVSQADSEVARLMARASAMLAQGNIGAARTLLEHAVDRGSAKASFALAETYDAAVLSAWGAYGTRGDAKKAREFYAKANAGGIREGKERFDALRD